MFPLDRLAVYGQARTLAAECHRLGDAMPDRDLRSQLVRSARSIPANLAEGAASESQANFARHIAIAIASARETTCHLSLAEDARLLTPAQCAASRAQLDALIPRLVRLLQAVRSNAKRRTT
ncbi:MAG: four helix bundle protein [Gemmatimonadota bacterium]|nr:four helix bundle protein [Gemmatimonadota bacterium]